jgi:hypothetical protein
VVAPKWDIQCGDTCDGMLNRQPNRATHYWHVPVCNCSHFHVRRLLVVHVFSHCASVTVYLPILFAVCYPRGCINIKFVNKILWTPSDNFCCEFNGVRLVVLSRIQVIQLTFVTTVLIRSVAL